MTAVSPPTAPAAPARRGGSKLNSLSALFVLTIRQNLHGKRWMVMAVLFLIPAALALVVRETAGEARPMDIEFVMAFMFIPQTLLPIGALLYASGMVRDELEEQTITYPLMRPISKASFYLTKLAATTGTVVVLVALFTTMTYVAIYAASGVPMSEAVRRCAIAMALHALAAAAYCCLFSLLAMYTRHAIVAGILYAALVEGLLANLPMNLRAITVIYYSRVIAYHSLPFISGDGENIAGRAWQLLQRDPDTGQMTLAGHPSAASCVAILLIGSAVCAALGALMCQWREFYVKTPGKE